MKLIILKLSNSHELTKFEYIYNQLATQTHKSNNCAFKGLLLLLFLLLDFNIFLGVKHLKKVSEKSFSLR